MKLDHATIVTLPWVAAAVTLAALVVTAFAFYLDALTDGRHASPAGSASLEF